MGFVLFGYIVLVIIGAAFLVGLGWAIYTLYHRGEIFRDPMLIDAKQSSYMRDVRMRELKRLATSNGDESDEEDEKKVRIVLPGSSANLVWLTEFQAIA